MAAIPEGLRGVMASAAMHAAVVFAAVDLPPWSSTRTPAGGMAVQVVTLVPVSKTAEDDATRSPPDSRNTRRTEPSAPSRPLEPVKPSARARPRPAALPLAPSPRSEPSTQAAQIRDEASDRQVSSVASSGPGEAPPPAAAVELAPTAAAYLDNPPPAYPAMARHQGMEGAVTLLVEVDPQGRPAKVELRRTSGFPILDLAAIKAVTGWRFRPASRDGHSVPARVEIPLRFRLKSSVLREE